MLSKSRLPTARPGLALPHPHRRRARPSPPTALLGLGDADGTGGVSAALMLTGIAGALALSAAPLLTGASARRNTAAQADRARRLSAGDPAAPLEEEEADADEVKWGAMSVIACVPVLNWLVRRCEGGTAQGARACARRGRGRRWVVSDGGACVRGRRAGHSSETFSG